MEEIKNITAELVEEISSKRSELIDLFVKTFIASRWEDYFSKQKKIDFKRIQLVEQVLPGKTIWYVELKKGKLKK